MAFFISLVALAISLYTLFFNYKESKKNQIYLDSYVKESYPPLIKGTLFFRENFPYRNRLRLINKLEKFNYLVDIQAILKRLKIANEKLLDYNDACATHSYISMALHSLDKKDPNYEELKDLKTSLEGALFFYKYR